MLISSLTTLLESWGLVPAWIDPLATGIALLLLALGAHAARLLLASRGLVGRARRGTMLDVDRVYWHLVPELVGRVVGAWRRLRGSATDALARFLRGSLQVVRDEAGPGGPLSRTWLTSTPLLCFPPFEGGPPVVLEGR